MEFFHHWCNIAVFMLSCSQMQGFSIDGRASVYYLSISVRRQGSNMEEIRFDSFGADLSSLGLSFLQEITEKSKQNGVQIGVPWSKDVYRYIFELSPAGDVETILENSVCGLTIIDPDNL